MIFYKEVHKYNGCYYSRYDNGYIFKVGEIAKPNGDYIYGTDSIESVLDYNYCPFDMAILELETIGKYKKSGEIIYATKALVKREVNKSEYDNKSTGDFSENGSDSLLFDLLKEARNSILSGM